MALAGRRRAAGAAVVTPTTAWVPKYVTEVKVVPSIIAACIALSVVALSWPVHADVSGSAVVIDGDTIEVGGIRIRLYGIDAPESGQTCVVGGKSWQCGRRATRALRDRIANRRVTCEERDWDGGRTVAVCRLGGSDLNDWMVSEGWVLAYQRYSRNYVAQEASARASRRGLWRGDFVAPWNWRAAESPRSVRRDTGSVTGQNTGECRIKGNISRRGERIYHVPGGHYYESTKISTSKGERWFCSEAEARSAGWRRSRR